MRTPRTDAGTKHLRTWWSDSEPGDTEMVKAELARQLETELAAMTKAKDQWQGMFHEVVKQRDAEREKVAKLREIATHFLRCPICAYDAAECERGARYMKALDETK